MVDQNRLIAMMSQADQVAPPDNFAESVWVRLKREENASTLKRVLLEPHYVSLEMSAILSGSLFQRGQVYLILLTGLFYLIAGLVLAIGQRWMPDMYLNEWVRNQAFIAFLSTGYFMLIWGNLKREKINVRFLRVSSIVYIAVLIMNFIFTSRIFTLPVSLVLSLFLMGLGLLTTSLLILSPADMEKECEIHGLPGK